MVDRQWLGDFALAVLLVLPFAALAGPQPALRHQSASPFVQMTGSDRLAGSGRVSLIG